jgi:dihydrofolate synthase/folylpolyglutamate synthase
VRLCRAGSANGAVSRTGPACASLASIGGSICRCRRFPAPTKSQTPGAGWELWLDGGHNPGAGAVLAEFVAGWGDRPLYLIVGMLNTKDSTGFLGPLAPHAQALAAVTIPGEQNPLPAEAITTAALSVGLVASTAASVGSALKDFSSRSPLGRVLICGSLHLAGTVLQKNS